jgi:ketosteroid isomerase-like protein
VNACADGDRTRIHATLTDDAAIELPLTDLGTFLLIDSANVADYCTVIGTSRHITSLWVYPTGDHAVVASFRQDGGKARLVLLDVREGHIARLREFTADDAQVRATVHQHLNVKDPS